MDRNERSEIGHRGEGIADRREAGAGVGEGACDDSRDLDLFGMSA